MVPAQFEAGAVTGIGLPENINVDTPRDGEVFRQLLAQKMTGLLPFLVSQHEELRQGDYDIDGLQRLVREAFHWLLHSPAPAATATETA